MIIQAIRQQSQVQPHHPALVVAAAGDGSEKVITYSELMTQVDQVAQGLRAQNVKPGDRCGMMAAQGAPFIIQALGLLEAGLCFVPISEDYTGSALQEFITGSRLHYLMKEDDGFGLTRFSDPGFVDNNGDRDYMATSPAYLRYTSGTTNKRKGVLIGHQAIMDRLAGANTALNIGPADRIMWMLPMAHHFVVSILLYLRFGATILLPSSYMAGPVLRLANSRAATIFYASPYHYDLLSKDRSELMLKSVRIAISTASGINLKVSQAFFQRMSIPLSQALGIIEMGLPVINLARPMEMPLSLGQVQSSYNVWLKGDDGQPVTNSSPDLTGEVCIRGAGAFNAYLNPWLPAREVTNPDGFCTGDQGYFDADGDLFLLGRRHNRINMAGMKFFCEEVEAVIDQFPGVKESRVSGKSHPRVGEIPVAEIVASDTENPPKLDELTRFCQKHLAMHKVPITFNFVPELPHTPTGKIQRWSGEKKE